ncbi:hypothetical protein BGZ59_006519 [Podila verticillata]|nr:hypothetical protein BGZ59_006519 [Podila verticillata]
MTSPGFTKKYNSYWQSCATLLNSGDFERKRSEDTCVFVWKYVRTTLIGKGSRVVFDVDELASEATKADIHKTELLFGTLTQSGGRKADTLFRSRRQSLKPLP